MICCTSAKRFSSGKLLVACVQLVGRGKPPDSAVWRLCCLERGSRSLLVACLCLRETLSRQQSLEAGLPASSRHLQTLLTAAMPACKAPNTSRNRCCKPPDSWRNQCLEAWLPASFNTCRHSCLERSVHASLETTEGTTGTTVRHDCLEPYLPASLLLAASLQTRQSALRRPRRQQVKQVKQAALK